MAQNVSLIGVQPEELPWMRLLVSLLRHPSGTIPELTRQALLYVSKISTSAEPSEPGRETAAHNGTIL